MLVTQILDSIDLEGGGINVIELTIGLIRVVEVNHFGLHWIARVNYYNWLIIKYAYHCIIWMGKDG